MKTAIYFLLFVLSVLCAHAQTQSKARVYGEVGLGFGQTLFFGDAKEKLGQTFGGSFKPGTGFNIITAFYVAPENWKGLGLGTRLKGTFGSSVKGEFDDDNYIFNFYSVQASAKYYPLSKIFNKGFYARLSAGFGQFTAKRLNEATNFYLHQYAIGSTISISSGYTLPLKRSSVSFEVEFESSSRNGTVNAIGSKNFQTGQLGFNTILTF